MRTVITDNERIVETVGAEPDWECLGTRTLDSSWANATAAADPGYPLNVPTTRTPFSRPAKAVRLTREDFLATYVTGAGAVEPYKLPIYPPEPGISPPAGIPAGTAWPPSPSGVGPGNYLVVDTGNDRVVEVDRKGRQVWPLANYAVPPTIPSGSRRLGDGLGFDFYTSPLNDVLDLQAPTDAQRYMLWNAATATWEMHTVIADSGHYRVIDVLTTFDYDVTTGSVLQTHEVQTVTPPLVRATTGPRRGEFIRVAYTRAQPLWDPGNGQLIGYLCAANNLHELLVIEAGTQRVNPPGADPLPSGSGGTWAMWSWLYDQDQDATTDDRLIFENLRHMEVRYERDEYGDPYLFLAVVCGRYQGPRSDPVTGTGRPFENVGAVCLEFRVGDPVLDDTDPATWVLKPSAAGWPIPCWYYTEADYQAGPLGHLWTPPGEGAGGQRITKEFSPVCVQRLSAGRHLIVNYRSVMENLTHANVPTATDAYACQGDQLRTPPSLAPDVFEVETRYATPNDPTTQLHTIDVDKCIPNPWLDDWNDPINQPSFAQRCQESLPPLRP